MKLVTFLKENKQVLGVKVKHGIIDIEAALSVVPEKNIKANIMELINGGEKALSLLEQYISKLNENADFMLDEKDLNWEPCITNPSKIICVGLNYRKHADETKATYPEVPILFNKFDNALTGHLGKVVVPNVTERLDYEVELGIVIGKTAKNVTKEEALNFVFGYCSANDLSARDIQKRTPQWMIGKTCDGFAPVGPYLVTSDEVGNPNNLKLTTKVNGEVRQDSNTSDMIFPCDEIVSYISQYMTLKPGDLILTGTPEGVVLGMPIEKRVYLRPGDEVTVEVEKLGALTNVFVSED